MQKHLSKHELLNKISLFNSMYMDTVDDNQNTKSWADYIDPITKKIFHQTYFEFIKANSIDQNRLGNVFDKYYNFFRFAVEYFSSLKMLPIVNDIYICCFDILNDFDVFIKTNGYHLRRQKIVEDNVVYYTYEIFPMVK